MCSLYAVKGKYYVSVCTHLGFVFRHVIPSKIADFVYNVYVYVIAAFVYVILLLRFGKYKTLGQTSSIYYMISYLKSHSNAYL